MENGPTPNNWSQNEPKMSPEMTPKGPQNDPQNCSKTDTQHDPPNQVETPKRAPHQGVRTSSPGSEDFLTKKWGPPSPGSEDDENCTVEFYGSIV